MQNTALGLLMLRQQTQALKYCYEVVTTKQDNQGPTRPPRSVMMNTQPQLLQVQRALGHGKGKNKVSCRPAWGHTCAASPCWDWPGPTTSRLRPCLPLLTHSCTFRLLLLGSGRNRFLWFQVTPVDERYFTTATLGS